MENLYIGEKLKLLNLINKLNKGSNEMNSLFKKDMNGISLDKNENIFFDSFMDVRFGEGRYDIKNLLNNGYIKINKNPKFISGYEITDKGVILLSNSKKWYYKFNNYIDDYKWIPLLISLLSLSISIISLIKK